MYACVCESVSVCFFLSNLFRLSVGLFFSHPMCLSACMSLHLSLSLCLSASPFHSLCLSVFLTVCPYCLSVFLCLPVSLSILLCQSVFLTVGLLSLKVTVGLSFSHSACVFSLYLSFYVSVFLLSVCQLSTHLCCELSAAVTVMNAGESSMASKNSVSSSSSLASSFCSLSLPAGRRQVQASGSMRTKPPLPWPPVLTL